MKLKVKGVAFNIQESIVATITRNRDRLSQNSALICEDYFQEGPILFNPILTNLQLQGKGNQPIVHSLPYLNHLEEGDIVAIHPNGNINTLYRVNSHQNFLFVTERCNSNCLMCSQPPKDREDTQFYFDLHKKLIPKIPKDCLELGITGGEPTLMGPLYFDMLKLLKDHLPETEIHCLSNGRAFAYRKFTDKLGEMSYSRLMLGIPLYSDFYRLHDYIVQAKGAFDQTVLGLYNLAENNVRIEVRIVLVKDVVPRLTKLAQFIYKNLPFVEHVAFMGLEHQGYTPFNIQKLWVDPFYYQEELREAVEFLSEKGMNVSIYNSQLCLLPQQLWSYSRKSISDWKNIYLPECNTCSAFDECGGLFASAISKHSDFIKAF